MKQKIRKGNVMYDGSPRGINFEFLMLICGKPKRNISMPITKKDLPQISSPTYHKKIPFLDQSVES